MAAAGEPAFLLGIDLGTTTVKAVLVNAATKEQVAEASAAHNAELPNLPPHHHEQSPEAILSAVHALLAKLEEEQGHVLETVKAIGISGQMHGCMLWDNAGWTSTLVTWMDGRGTTEFITSLPSTKRSNILHSGYGTVSLAWLQRNGLIPTDRPIHAGTIMDYLVCKLSGEEKVMMTHMLADSWGYFDYHEFAWDRVFVEMMPAGLLPRVVRAGEWAGALREPFYGVPAATPILAALGDFQAHFYASEKQTCAILNVGTSSQLSYQMPAGYQPPLISDYARNHIQYFPYLGDRWIGIAASLNGGNILDAFLQAFKSWVGALAPGVTLPDDDAMWERMEVLLERWEEGTANAPVPTTTPLLFGERHDPEATASVTGLTEPNISNLGGILGSLVVGLVSNLFSMITPERLRSGEVKEIVLTGLATKPWFAPAVRRFLGKQQFTISTAAKRLDSAYGSALIAGQFIK